MKSSNIEWIKRAVDDLRAVKSLSQDGIYSIACFEAQQCAEKSLKAFLLQQEQDLPKIHNLAELLRLCGKYNDDFMQFQKSVEWLDKFYCPTRYPDAVAGILPKGWPDEKETDKAEKIAEDILEFVKKTIDLL